MMSLRHSTKIVMTPGAGVPVLGCGCVSHIVEILNFCKILFSTAEHRSDNLSQCWVSQVTVKACVSLVLIHAVCVNHYHERKFIRENLFSFGLIFQIE